MERKVENSFFPHFALIETKRPGDEANFLPSAPLEKFRPGDEAIYWLANNWNSFVGFSIKHDLGENTSRYRHW